MNFAELIAAQRDKDRSCEDKRIRAQAAMCAKKRYAITDATVIAAFADKAAQFREAGNDPEPALLLAFEALKVAA